MPHPDDTTPCHDCGLTYYERLGSYWLTDDALWQRIVGDDSVVLCPRCFVLRGRAIGVSVSWRAAQE